MIRFVYQVLVFGYGSMEGCLVDIGLALGLLDGFSGL